MGIDDLDKTWWERNVSEPYLKEHYEEHPLLSIGAEHIGGGISDFFTEKIPNLASHYWGKDSEHKNFEDLYGVYPAVEDLAKHAGNFGWWLGDELTDIGLNTLTMAQQAPNYLYNAATIPQNVLSDVTGVEGLRAEPLGKGWRATGTWLQDTASDLTGGLWGHLPPTEMRTDAVKYHNSIQPPAALDYKGKKTNTADHNLSNWGLYQDWKKGSGSDFRIIEREANDAARKSIEDWVKGEGSPDKMMAEWEKNRWSQLSKDEQSLYDKGRMFTGYYNANVNYKKNFEKNKYELSKTGGDFGKWLSHKYQNEMISEYGRYPLMDKISDMSRDISPIEGVEINFNLANEDWINAMKSGKTVDEIGAPNEFDYGAFDRESGVGINEWADWQPFEHGSQEAEEFYESGPLFAAEMILGQRWSRLPEKLTKALSKGKKGRILREISPGLFQNQGGWGLGRPQNFGIVPRPFKDAKMRDEPVKAVADWLMSVPDWLRPKGGQAGVAIALGERD